MVKKLLLLKVFTFWALILTSVVGWGQNCTPPTVTITNNSGSSICDGETISFTGNVNFSGSVSYQWQVSHNGGTFENISGAISKDLSGYDPLAGSNKFKLVVDYTCPGDSTIYSEPSPPSSTITVYDDRTASITISASNTTICPGESISFTTIDPANLGATPQYEWQLVRGGTTSTLSTSASFSNNTLQNGDQIRLYVTSSVPCVDPVFSTNSITIIEKPGKPAVPGNISITSGLNDDGLVCPNSSITLSIDDVPRASSYKWTLPSGWTGQTTGTEITVTTGAVGNGKVVKVQAINDCGTTENQMNISVGPGKPATPSEITSPSLICPQDEVTLSITNDSSLEYTWAVPTGWSIISGQGSNQITATAGNNSQSGAISVYATNACLDSDTRSKNLTINDPAPETPASITGNAVVCPAIEVTYSITETQYADSYVWTYDGVVLQNQTGTSITFPSGTPGGKELTVAAVNECGQSTTPQSRTITVDEGTPDEIAITSPAEDGEFCPQTSNLVFSVPPDSKVDDGYTWTVPTGWSIASGQGSNEITVASGNLNQDGNITVTAKSDHCGEVSASFLVTVKNPAPSTAGISISGPEKVCATDTGIVYEIPAIDYADDYVWNVPGNWNIISGNNTNKITVNAGTDDILISVYTLNECGDSGEPIEIPVVSTDEAPNAPAAIRSTEDFINNPNVCPPYEGMQFEIDPVDGATVYEWKVPAGWNITDTNASGTSVTVSASAANNYNDTEVVQVRAGNGCYWSEFTSSFPIVIDDYILTDVGADKTLCRSLSQVQINANVLFGKSKFTPTLTATGRAANAGFQGLPGNRVTGSFSFYYTPVQADLDRGSVTIKMTVPKPNGNNTSCGTGEDEMIIFFRPDPTATIVGTTAICDGNSADLTVTSTPNTTVTYTINNGSEQTILVGGSGTATLNTGTLNAVSNIDTDFIYTITKVKYADELGCEQAVIINNSATVTVTPTPSVDISYDDAYCNSVSVAEVSFTDGIGKWDEGVFTASGALAGEINAESGIFSPANVTPGTYTVTYTIDANGGCGEEISTTEVTIYEQVQITTEPSNTRVCEGENAQFSVSATGDGLTYKWFKGALGSGTAVANGDSATLNLNNVSTSNAGDYYVEISGASPCGAKESAVVNLLVDPNITISEQPTNTEACVGDTANFSVTAAAGGETLNYQWYKGSPGSGTAVGTANSTGEIEITGTTTGSSGDYYVVISGTGEYQCEAVTSDAATLTIRETPTAAISGSAEICDGLSTEISITGTPGTTVTYTINGGSEQMIDLDASGEATLSTGALSVINNDVTDYDYTLSSVQYTNGSSCAATVTGSATITVNPTPDVNVSFENDQVTFCNDTYQGTFTPTLTGSGAYLGGVFSAEGLTVDEETGAFTPANATAGNYTLKYYLGEAGGCSELAATLDIDIFTSVEITSEPFPVAVCTANSTQLEMAASGDDLSYQWYKVTDGDDTKVGTNSPILELNNATSSTGGNYYVIVSGNGACGPVTSEEVSVTVDENIVIAAEDQPQGQNICAGEQATLRVSATASGDNTAIQYQWEYRATAQDTWSDFEAAETGDLFSEISTGQAGEYRARIDGPDGFSCDTGYSQIVKVSTFEAPTAGAGEDFEICSTETSLTIGTGATAENFTKFEWTTTNGLGTFIQGNTPAASTYAPVEGDYGKTLDFTLITIFEFDGEQICSEATDTKLVTIIPQPVITEFSYIVEDNTAVTGDFCETDNTTYTPHINGDHIADTDGIGTFTVNKSGLTVNSSTGAFSPNGTTPATYIITYTFKVESEDAGCTEASKAFEVIIGKKPIADFSYEDTPFCSDAENPLPVMADDAIKGTFSATPSGLLFIDDQTGEINIAGSTPGEYTITNTIAPAEGCAEVKATAEVTINQKPDPPIVENVAYCLDEEGVPVLTAIKDNGATLNWYDTVDATTASGTAPQPNTTTATTTSYWVSQTSAAGCESDRKEVTVTINALPEVTITTENNPDGNDVTICKTTTISLTGNGATSYTWRAGSLESEIISNEAMFGVTPAETTTYFVVGQNDAGCEDITQITIEVDEPTAPGSLSGPESVCISNPTGLLNLIDFSGEIQRWEKSEDGGITWSGIDVTTESYQFPNLTTATSFRAIVKSGVCNEMPSNQIDVIIDALPVGGDLSWSNDERIYLTCEIQSNNLDEILTLKNESGQIVEWEYRTASTLTWATYNSQNPTLTLSDFQSILPGTAESTVFRAKIVNGTCDEAVFSQTAILSVIPSDIKPSPVEVDPEVLCYGNEISLSSQTGYGAEYGKFEGGDFTSAGIKNNGWDFTDPDGKEINYNANADSGTPIHWHKTQPKWKFITADINSPYNTSEQWWNPRNDGKQNEHFAIAQSTYSSNMDTPSFNLLATDEAVLTFDQAFNLTTGATIRVVLLKNGVEYKELYKVVGPAKSFAQDHFGYGEKQVNQMTFDLGSYIGESNLRVRFEYRGVRLGDVWAVDNIKVPEGPQDVLLQWFYDEDPSSSTNELEQIGVDNQNTVSFTPRKIGWNDFEVKTALLLDSNGDPCYDIHNSETVKVFVFDQYTTSVTANTGECGNTKVTLNASVTGAFQGDVTEEFIIDDYQTIDGYSGSWVITGPNEDYTLSNIDSQSTLDPRTNPNILFEGTELGNYTFTWVLTSNALYPDDFKNESLRGQPVENTGCPPITNTNEVTLPECTTLDFDGINDYVSIDNVFAEAQTIEMWIYPEASGGTIISGPGFEINMSDLAGVSPNSRWYHIALIRKQLYIDGIDSGKALNTTGTGNQTLIGAKWNSATKVAENYFSGWIEEVRIWKTALTVKELHFMMNQRLDLNSKGSGDVSGEIVPNKTVPGSYYTSGGFNLDQDGDAFYNEKWSDLLAYYRLISAVPDPTLNIIPDTYKPINGYTPDLSAMPTPVNGRLHNMTTDQENTSPTPYLSGADDIWADRYTWARPLVWDYPNSKGIDDKPITWNIARTSHNITSESKNIIVLGLLSDDGLLSINNDNPVRITHYLLLNGNIDLEGESQLLQDHGSILDNDSAGWLERDQQGKMLSYNYNYWSSPVCTQGGDNNSGYTVGGVLWDGTNAGTPQPITFKDGYYVADGAKTNPLTISNYWIWKFHGTADTYGEWYYTGSTGTLLSAEGYTMKGTDGTVGLGAAQNYVFRGKPHNGNIFDLSIGKEQNYLVGNPYPSAIDGIKFIKDNLKDGGNNSLNIINGALYFWDHFNGYTHVLEEYIGGYATLNLLTSVEAASTDWRINANDEKSGVRPGNFIPVGQAFFVNTVPVEGSSMTINGGNIIFKNTQRTFKTETGSGGSIFLSQERKDARGDLQTQQQSPQFDEEENSVIWFKFRSPKGYHRQIAVGSNSQATDDFDLGYDAPLIENNIEDMFWYFENNKFVIQGIKEFTKDKELDLGVKISEKGELTIKLDDLQNFPDELPILLKDELLKIIHDLREGPYKTESEAGTFTDRFKIVFQDTTIVEPEPEPEEPEVGDFKIMYVNGTREIFIMNPHKLEIEKVYLNNMLGQQVHMFYDIPNKNLIKLPVSRFGSGVYVVKVYSEEGITTKKVILE